MSMNIFSEKNMHTVTSANINFYTAPFVHPKRAMQEHDFIYMLSGEWVIGQNGISYELKEDTLLILFAGNTHYGISPCRADSKTMYFHASLEEGDRFTNDSLGIETCMRLLPNSEIKKIFENIVDARLSGEERKANLLFELLLCELKSQKNENKEKDFARNIKNLIHSYPEKFFTNRALAAMSNVSVKTAENKFNAYALKSFKIRLCFFNFKMKYIAVYSFSVCRLKFILSRFYRHV